MMLGVRDDVDDPPRRVSFVETQGGGMKGLFVSKKWLVY